MLVRAVALTCVTCAATVPARALAAPENDDFENATIVAGLPFSDVRIVDGATIQALYGRGSPEICVEARDPSCERLDRLHRNAM